jgi:hypothetical protein
MSILSYAFNHDKENLWFCLLTDTCVPIISPRKFRQLFFDHYQASIINCKSAYWDITIHRRANLRLLNKEYHLSNDPWFTLCRAHVHKCLIFLVAKHGIYQKVNEGGLANESIFAIILQTFKELTNPLSMINESCSIADWSRMSSPTSPYFFKEDNVENINIICKLLKENKYAMFLRKVHRDFPDKALQMIMDKDKDFGHTYEMLHNQAKKKDPSEESYFINILQFFLVLLVCIFFMTDFPAKIIMNT